MKEQLDIKATVLLGHGVYNIPEVARYTGLHHQRIRSWFSTRLNEQAPSLFHSEYPIVNGDCAVSFLDLIEVFVAGQFRNSGMSLQSVRKMHAGLKELLRTNHPFCHDGLYTDGKRGFVEMTGQLGHGTHSEVLTRQQFFSEVILPHLRRIEYSKKTGLAARWRMAHGVVIDPAVSLGKPVVESTGITTFVLSKCYWANDGDDSLAADLFSVHRSDVMNAVAFEEVYGLRRAA